MTREDQQAFFTERAAILELDNGMPRAEAEAQAVAELYDALQARPPMGILAELARADRTRHSPQLRDCLQACGLVDVRGPAWGFGWCVFDCSTYRPADPDDLGRSCLIVPSTEDGALVDLVAMDLADRHMATRLGVAAVVGADAIDRARETQKPLFVFSDTAAWLRGGTRGAVVVDWSRAANVFDGCKLLLSAESIADRLRQATAHCWQRPDVMILKDPPHAA